MRLKKRISQVRELAFCDKIVLSIGMDAFIMNPSNYTLKIIHSFSNDFSIVDSCNEKIVFTEGAEKNILFDLKNEIKTEINFSCFVIKIIGKGILLLKEENERWYLGLYDDANNFNPVWTLDISAKVFEYKSSLIIFPQRVNEFSKKCFERVLVESGTKLWKYQIPDSKFYSEIGEEIPTEISKVLGIVQGNLWIGLTNGTILILDFESGKEVTTIRHPFYSFSDNENIFPDTSSMYLDEKSGVALGCLMDQYWEVNLKTFEVQHWDLTDHFESEKVFCSSGKNGEFIFDDEFIYFMDRINCKVAILNRKEKKIVWQYKFISQDNWAVFPMKIHLFTNKLFVIDNKNVLHVFERTI